MDCLMIASSTNTTRMSPLLIGHPGRLPSPSAPVSQRALLSDVENLPHQFLQPTRRLNEASIQAAKYYLDPLAQQTSLLQHQRQDAFRQNRKRKRGGKDASREDKPLALTGMSTAGFEMDQIWGQAKWVLDAAITELLQSIPLTTPDVEDLGPTSEEKNGRPAIIGPDELDHTPLKKAAFTKGQSEDLEKSDSLGDTSNPESGVGLEDPFDQIRLSHDDEEDLGDQDAEEFHSEMSQEYEAPAEIEVDEEQFIPDKLGLNDGFFSIDEFNRKSEFLEQRDARGEDDGAASDEEDVDWDVDPLTAGSKPDAPPDQDLSIDELSVEDDGPTFGNGDSMALDSDIEHGLHEETESQGLLDMENTNEVMYADFFAPPPKKLTKSARMRALPKTQPPVNLEAPYEANISRAMADVRRDIFEDDSEPEASVLGSDDQIGSRSSHQKRQAELTAEIRRLEAEAVAKKPWTLAGEARAGDRPLNSLLEEDLDFERAGKPVPVITQEVSEDIEALIKRRIINREFDEIIRRRPGALTASDGKSVRRGRIELEDGKPSQSLAELYEADHLRSTDPNGYVDKQSESLKKEHNKIEMMWKDVSAKLDALSNLHFRPKPPEMNVNVVTDLPTIMMEDARPNAGADLGASMLAPQEIYKAGEQRDKKTEVTTRSGLAVGRVEMSKEERIRRRRREKERIKKSGGLPFKNGVQREKSKQAEQGDRVVGDLKKGGVKVIGKKGEIRDIDGKEARKGALPKGAGAYKL